MKMTTRASMRSTTDSTIRPTMSPVCECGETLASLSITAGEKDSDAENARVGDPEQETVGDDETVGDGEDDATSDAEAAGEMGKQETREIAIVAVSMFK
jgi:hypothetical protein